MIISKLSNFNFRVIINLLLSILPLSFIAGNLIINLNITLIIIVSLIFWGREFFKIDILLIDKLIIFLFFFSTLTSLINFNNFFSSDPYLAKENLIKSFTFIRYLFFYFSIRLIIEKDYFDIKTFFIFSGICVIFVSLDLILQFYSGKDIFGFPKAHHKLSGPFGDELIAGSYLQRFCLFLFFLIPFYKNLFSKRNLILILLLLFILIFFSVVIAGNRMSVILLMMLFVFLFLNEKQLRKFVIILVPLILILFFTLYKFYPNIKEMTDHFLTLSVEIIFSLDEIYNNPNLDFSNMYLKEFHLGYMTWKENIIIGGGINSFYLNCKINYDICTSHPHNYYLEILSELGIIGICVVSIIFVKLLHIYFKIKNNFNLSYENNVITAFVLLLFVEMFPLKTTGSFFTTGNASYIFLLIATIVGLSNKFINYKKNQF
jgi:O-antigen ligase